MKSKPPSPATPKSASADHDASTKDVLSPLSSSVHSSSTKVSLPPVNEDDFEVGGQVLTLFGRGRILQVRSTQVKVHILPWKLANGESKVFASIPNDQVLCVLSKCRASGMDLAQKREYVQALKRAAVAQGQARRYGCALDLYRKTIAVVTALLQETRPGADAAGSDSSTSKQKHSAERADWLVTVVRCSNNAAAICLQLDLFEDCMSLTRNAMLVLDALQGEQRPSFPGPPTDTAMALQLAIDKTDSNSSCEEKKSAASPQQVGQVRLFGECKIQSLLYMAAALLKVEQASACKKTCEQAQTILKQYSGREYLERSEYKSTLKRLVSLQKQIKALKKQARQAMKGKASGATITAAAATAAMKAGDTPVERQRTRKISWFDGFTSSATPKRSNKAAGGEGSVLHEDDTTEEGDGEDFDLNAASTSWYTSQRALAYGTVVVGTIVLAGYLLNRRRLR